jgi:hypothetical protein
MTATDELRRLLDGRGVEYKDRNVFGKHVFHWGKPFHGAMFTDAGEWTELVVENASPEQAVEATLGRGTCRITVEDNLAETEGTGDVWLECSACHWQMLLEPTTPRFGYCPPLFSYCPNCGRKVVDS